VKRREFLTLIGGAAVLWPRAVRAQRSGNLRRIGLLMVYQERNPEVQGWLAAFRKALAKLGWTENQNIHFEFRWAGVDLDRIQQGARELIELQPDLIIASSSPSTAALVRQTRTIPIVFVNIVDPVGQGFVTSLSRPGGNATGLVNLETSMAGKLVELLKDVMPALTRVAIPFHPATSPYADFYLKYLKSTASTLGAEVIAAPVHDIAALEAFAAAQARESNTGIVPVPSAFMLVHLIEMAAMMARFRLPAVHFDRAFVEAGGLLSYGNDIADNYRRSGTFVDRILKGDKPSDLPVEFPVKFDLAVNLNAAKALGLIVPPTLLATADEVIE